MPSHDTVQYAVPSRAEDDGGAVIYRPSDPPRDGWRAHAAALFAERMLDHESPFPCIFGVDAVRRDSLRYTFISQGSQRLPALAEALTHFAVAAPEFGKRTSLVAFFEPDPDLATIDDHRRHFWDLLRGLREIDEADWPDGIDPDPDSPTWEFSYAGCPMFVVANTPAHRARRSRQFDYFTVTFQPRFVFDGLETTTAAGQRARRVIRGRLAAYDDAPQSPLLGSFGDPDNREWRQYFLEDHNQPVPGPCPLHATSSPSPRRQPIMSAPTFDERAPAAIPATLADILPPQGSYEMQHDQPGKTHNWHKHSLDEELWVLSGGVSLFWQDSATGEVHTRDCPPGTWISLPAGTVHGSTAGDAGAVYVIRPAGGATAVTTWLAPDDYPRG